MFPSHHDPFASVNSPHFPRLNSHHIIQQFDNIHQTTQKQLVHAFLLHHKAIEEKYEASSNGLVKMINEEVRTYSEEQKAHHERTMKATNTNLNQRAKNKLAAGNNKWSTLYLEKTGHKLQHFSSFLDSDSPDEDALTPILNMKEDKVPTTIAGNPKGVGPPPTPGSHLSALELPMEQTPPGDTYPDQSRGNKEKGKGKGKKRVTFSPSSPNDSPSRTRPSTDQASHSSSSSSVPYHSPTLDQGEYLDEIVTFSSACTPSPTGNTVTHMKHQTQSRTTHTKEES